MSLGNFIRTIACFSFWAAQARLSPMESQLDWHSARALLEWQVELGATEAILDAPVDRFTLETTAPKPVPVTAPAAQATGQQASALHKLKTLLK